MDSDERKPEGTLPEGGCGRSHGSRKWQLRTSERALKISLEQME
jgi:hypothetical protein